MEEKESAVTPNVVVNGDYKGNSNKSKETPRVEEREKKGPVVTGTVKQKKKGFWRKTAESFTGDDAQSVGSYLMFEVLIPASKTLISDMVSQGIERALYGETAVRPRARTIESRGQSYRTASNSRAQDRQGFNGSRRVEVRNTRNRYDFDEFVFDSRVDGNAVLDRLLESIDEYGVATVAEFHEAVGHTDGDYIDNRFGWFTLDGVNVIRSRHGYVLNLPEPDSIK